MQLEQRIVHTVLSEWGSYEESQLDRSFYAKITPLWRYMMEGRPGKPVFSSTILSYGTPLQILKIKQAIKKLSDQQQQIVAAQYIYHVKPEGGLWTSREKAETLGYTYSTWQTNLHRARARLLPWL